MDRISLEVVVERLDNIAISNNAAHSDILEQVRKTNGTTIANSKDIRKLQDWQNRLIGGWIVLVAIIVPIATALIYFHRL